MSNKDIVEYYVSKFVDRTLNQRDFIDNLTFLTDQAWWRKNLTLFELYRKAIPKHGDIWICGARWGNQLPLFAEFREVLEPHNFQRSIVGFDTFSGFPKWEKVKGEERIKEGLFSVTEEWVGELPALASAHSNTLFNGSYRVDIVKGNVLETIPEYLESHPQTLISLVYMDLDLYEPTLATLKNIYPRLMKGSIIVFDELNDPIFPGETVAMLEFFNELGVKPDVQRLPFSERISYVVVD